MTTTPANATGVSINSKGELKVTSSTTATSIVVRATSKDEWAQYGQVTLAVRNKTSTVNIRTADTSGRATWTWNTARTIDRVSKVALFTINPQNVTDYDRNVGASRTSVNETTITLTARTLDSSGNSLGNAVTWKSNNTKVATVSSTGVVTAHKAGKATITATASDGTGKKSTVTINVGNPASSLWVQGKRSLTSYSTPTLAFGKSLNMSAVAHSAYGKVTNSKVTWKCELGTVTRCSSNDCIACYLQLPCRNSASLTLRPAWQSKVKITSTGKLTIDKSLQTQWASNIGDAEFVVRVTATAKDGSGVIGTILVYLCPPTSAVTITRSLIYGSSQYPYFIVRGSYFNDYVVTSSNPKVLAVKQIADKVCLVPLSKGESTVRVVANDGTGKYSTWKIKVN